MEETMKMKYTKIAHFGEEITSVFTDGNLHIEEKIDGSQFRVYVNDGKVECGSKAIDFTDERPADQMFLPVVKEAEAIFKDSGLTDTNIFLEFLRKPKHNTLTYARVPKHNMILFDVFMDGKWLKYGDKTKFAKKYDLEVPQCLWKGNGKLVDMKLIEDLLKIDSMLGNEKVEGIIFKNYDKIWSGGYQIGKLIMLKYVREEFKERNAKEWKTNTKKGFIEGVIESLRTEARWDKAIQHLRDEGKLTNSPKDIGELLRELVNDTELEEVERLKNELWKHFWNDIKRGIIRGFPEYYKKKLMEDALEGK
jgi:ATP-dependent RNA circularization protein (DNA/RNA ligase family)